MKRDVSIIAYVTAIAGVAAALTVPWLLAVILPVAGLVMYLAYRQEPRSPQKSTVGNTAGSARPTSSDFI